MGFDKASCDLLVHVSRAMGIDYGELLTLGRQQIFISTQEAKDLLHSTGVGDAPIVGGLDLDDGFSEPFLRAIGAAAVTSMDYSDYEGATIVHDLNVPVPSSLHERFDSIIDGGTIEHVFHFPNAIESCMRMLKVGGHFIGITPANNLLGHGFYQFSPELFFRLLGKENGFEVLQVLIQTPTEWYVVSDPEQVHDRVQLLSSVPILMVVIARKVAGFEKLTVPQQSDYMSAWATVDSLRRNEKLEDESTIRFMARKLLPTPVKTMLRNVKEAVVTERVDTGGLLGMNTAHFKKIILNNGQTQHERAQHPGSGGG